MTPFYKFQIIQAHGILWCMQRSIGTYAETVSGGPRMKSKTRRTKK